MINSISFITGNSGKYSDAIEFFKETGIQVKQLPMDTPEIQSENPEDISKYSANFLKDILKEPFFVMDRSFSITSLNGFPGPFVKYMNKWITEEKFTKLFNENDNKTAKWTTSISCYIPGKEVVTFSGENVGIVTLDALGEEGYMVDKVFIPNGSTKTLAQMNQEERTLFWNTCSCWKELLTYLKEN